VGLRERKWGCGGVPPARQHHEPSPFLDEPAHGVEKTRREERIGVEAAGIHIPENQDVEGVQEGGRISGKGLKGRASRGRFLNETRPGIGEPTSKFDFPFGSEQAVLQVAVFPARTALDIQDPHPSGRDLHRQVDRVVFTGGFAFQGVDHGAQATKARGFHAMSEREADSVLVGGGNPRLVECAAVFVHEANVNRTGVGPIPGLELEKKEGLLTQEDLLGSLEGFQGQVGGGAGVAQGHHMHRDPLRGEAGGGFSHRSSLVASSVRDGDHRGQPLAPVGGEDFHERVTEGGGYSTAFGEGGAGGNGASGESPFFDGVLFLKGLHPLGLEKAQENVQAPRMGPVQVQLPRQLFSFCAWKGVAALHGCGIVQQNDQWGGFLPGFTPAQLGSECHEDRACQE